MVFYRRYLICFYPPVSFSRVSFGVFSFSDIENFLSTLFDLFLSPCLFLSCIVPFLTLRIALSTFWFVSLYLSATLVSRLFMNLFHIVFLM